MGLLSEGKPLSWAETKQHAELVRRTGIKQFLGLYHRLKERKGDTLKWGDEVSPRGGGGEERGGGREEYSAGDKWRAHGEPGICMQSRGGSRLPESPVPQPYPRLEVEEEGR